MYVYYYKSIYIKKIDISTVNYVVEKYANNNILLWNFS